MNKEIYLHNLEWTQTHENYGGVKGEFVLIDNIDYKEYEKILKRKLYITDINLQQRIDKALEEIKKELKENNHLSYGVALSIISILNDYEEILITEEPKKIEKIDVLVDNIGMEYIKGLTYGKNYSKSSIEFAKKLNEIIDYINKGDTNDK